MSHQTSAVHTVFCSLGEAMQEMLVVTGTTDDYGLRKFEELLGQLFQGRAALEALKALRTYGNLPGYYCVQLTATSDLKVARKVPTNRWQFAVTVVGNPELVRRTRAAFMETAAADVNFGDIVITVPGGD